MSCILIGIKVKAKADFKIHDVIVKVDKNNP